MIEIKTIKYSGTKMFRLKSMYKQFESILVNYSKKWLNNNGFLYFIDYSYDIIGMLKSKPILKYRFNLTFGVRCASDNSTAYMDLEDFINMIINSVNFRKLIEYFEEKGLIKIL